MDEKKRLGEYNSVGGSSTHVLFNFPGYGALYMGSIISISYSTYRDKTPVYNLGGTNIDGFAFGKRYIAGSIVKTLFMNDDLRQFLTKVKNDIGLKTELNDLRTVGADSIKTYHHLLLDDLLPFDIIIVMGSEYGSWAISEVIYGATFINTGQVHSIADIITETTMSFVANDARTTHDEIGGVIRNLSTPNGEKAASQINNSDISQSINGEYSSGTNQDINKVGSSDEQSGNLYISDPGIVNSGNNWIQGSTDINTEDLIFINATEYVVNKDGIITGAHDGDTLKFRLNHNGKETIRSTRLTAIDTPEVAYMGSDEEVLTQPFGIEAKMFLDEYMTSGKWDRDVAVGDVKIMGVDKYGRLLVFNKNYSISVLQAGLAHITGDFVRQMTIPDQDKDMLNDALKYAKENKLGIWGGDAPVVSPSDWRKLTSDKMLQYGGTDHKGH